MSSTGGESNNGALDSAKKFYNDAINLYTDVSKFSITNHISDTRKDVNVFLSTNRNAAIDTTSAFAEKYNPITFLHKHTYEASEYINENQKYASLLCRSHPSAMVAASSTVVLLPFAFRFLSKSLRYPRTTIVLVGSVVTTSTAAVTVVNYKWNHQQAAKLMEKKN